MFAHNLLDRLGRLVCIIKWDSGYIVMENMSFDDPMEHGTSNETELAINGSCSSPSVAPCGVVVVRERRITVLQERDSHCDSCEQAETCGIKSKVLTQPVIDPEIREKIPHCQIGPTEFAANQVKNAGCDGNTQITQQD